MPIDLFKCAEAFQTSEVKVIPELLITLITEVNVPSVLGFAINRLLEANIWPQTTTSCDSTTEK